jgi:hypothetical protein
MFLDAWPGLPATQSREDRVIPNYASRTGRGLVMAVALDTAVSTGQWDAETNPIPGKKV